MDEITDIQIIHYQYPDGDLRYSGTINYADGDKSATLVKTNGELMEYFIDNRVPYDIWEKCKPITVIKFGEGK